MATLFSSNVTVLVRYNDTLGQVSTAGYLFVTSNSPDTQEQRWVLLPGYMPLPETGVIRFEVPPSEFNFIRLADWVAAVDHGGLWTLGSTYVKASSRSYTATADAMSAMLNPDAYAPQFPPLTPKEPSALLTSASFRFPQQVDSHEWRMQGNVSGPGEWTDVGMMYGTKVESARNHEYWVTYPGYQPPSPALTRLKNPLKSSVEDFLKGARSNFPAGSTFTIASCSYLATQPADP